VHRPRHRPDRRHLPNQGAHTVGVKRPLGQG
jgi:hypothetical protein